MHHEQDEGGVKDIHLKIMKFFKENPKVNDKDVHAFADVIGMNPHEFEGHIYMIMSSFFAAGRAFEVGLTEDKVDPEQLRMGIEVEMEHTTDPEISKRISLDHLAELPDYYTRLAKMEKEGEAAKEESE